MEKKYRCTVDDVMSWKPCGWDDPENGRYQREYVEKLFGRKKYLTASDILCLKIPLEDRFWAVLRAEMVPDKVLFEFACWCAENALRRERRQGREPDERSWKAVEMRRRWLRGEATDEELSAAWSAAESAAWSAAARSAARSAAESAEREWQLNRLCERTGIDRAA